jgi:hypothetical protein
VGTTEDQFDDLNEYLTPDFSLPVNGTTYGVSPSASLVLRIRNWYTDADSSGDDILALIAEIYGADYDAENKVITGVDGSVWAQMEADGVSGEQLMRVGTTTALWFGMSHEMALRFWKQGNLADPKAQEPKQTPNRATRRATARKKGSSKADTAGTTPNQEP